MGIVSSGMTILIILGEIDISAGANIGLSSCIMAMLLQGSDSSFCRFWWVFLLLLVIVFLLVSLQRFLEHHLLLLLAFISVFQGIALAITKGFFQTIYGKFETIGMARFAQVLPLSFIISIGAYLLSISFFPILNLGVFMLWVAILLQLISQVFR